LKICTESIIFSVASPHSVELLRFVVKVVKLSVTVRIVIFQLSSVQSLL
jgi:hypothetical protein